MLAHSDKVLIKIPSSHRYFEKDFVKKKKKKSSGYSEENVSVIYVFVKRKQMYPNLLNFGTWMSSNVEDSRKYTLIKLNHFSV